MIPWILAIDTSTEACSCALGNGEQVFSRYTDIPRKHAEKVLPMVDELLAEANIDRTHVSAIAFGRGPGAFTGLRIAASVVQGLAFALDVPVIPVSSLRALAQRGFREHGYNNVLAAIDARMGEIYWSAYQVDQEQRMSQIGEETLVKPEALNFYLEGGCSEWAAVGTGWLYQAQMPAPINALLTVQSAMLTHAVDVLELALPLYAKGELFPVEHALPTYIRNDVAHQKTPPQKT